MKFLYIIFALLLVSCGTEQLPGALGNPDNGVGGTTGGGDAGSGGNGGIGGTITDNGDAGSGGNGGTGGTITDNGDDDEGEEDNGETGSGGVSGSGGDSGSGGNGGFGGSSDDGGDDTETEECVEGEKVLVCHSAGCDEDSNCKYLNVNIDCGSLEDHMENHLYDYIGECEK